MNGLIVYNVVRDTLEILCFVTTPILAWLAWKGLRQIEVSREIARTNAKRESFRIAAERTEAFGEQVIPLWSEFSQLREQGKYPIISATKVIESWPNIQCHNDNFQGLLNEVFSNNALIVRIVNKMEGFAMFFTCGIADADIAYRPVSSVFCEATKSFLPYLIVANERDRHFSYTIALYAAWAMRAQKESTEKQIALHNQQLSKIKVPDIKPFGTI